MKDRLLKKQRTLLPLLANWRTTV